MKDKIKFEDIFDLIDIEKTFEQTIEYDILKLMQKLDNEKKEQQGRQQLINEEDEHIKEIVRKVLKEENNSLFAKLNYFKNKFIKLIQFIKNKLFNKKIEINIVIFQEIYMNLVLLNMIRLKN